VIPMLLLRVLIYLLLQTGAFASDLRVPHVVIMGGGVAGLSAAQELAERGYKVTVLEMQKRFGGTSALAPNDPLFFEGRFQNLFDTFKRIPTDTKGATVHDQLEPSVELPYVLKAEVAERAIKAGVSVSDVLFFLKRLYVFASASSERRYIEFSELSWWDFIQAKSRSDAYQRFFALGLSFELMGSDALNTRANAVATVVVNQLLHETKTDGYWLNGPRRDLWFRPWVNYLKKLDVKLLPEHTVIAIESDDGGNAITGVKVETKTGIYTIQGDYYIGALPPRVLAQLLPDSLNDKDPYIARALEVGDALVRPGGWWNRPEADSGVGNLFLAADTVRTSADLPGMEASNEAARRAVNAVIEDSGGYVEPVQVIKPQEPFTFRFEQWMDRQLFRHGFKHRLETKSICVDLLIKAKQYLIK